MKTTITINRGNGSIETITGTIIAETTTHVLLVWDDNPEQGEWFAKRSKNVNRRKE